MRENAIPANLGLALAMEQLTGPGEEPPALRRMKKIIAGLDDPRPEKEAVILAAAMDEFGRSGYKAASTNAIARQASVAKGLLFHYFDSKQTLYNACVTQAAALFTREMYMRIPSTETDLFKRINALTLHKAAYFRQHISHARLLGTEFLENAAQTGSFWQDYYVAFTYLMYRDVDTSRFRPDYGPNEIFRFVLSVFELYSRQIFTKYQGHWEDAVISYEPILQELQKIEGLIQFGIYQRKE